MSYMLPHLNNGWQVDQAILSEEDRVVVVRFGHDWDPSCMRMDETLYKIANKVKNFAVVYLVDITEVPDFNKMYELYDPCTIMFFFRNKHIMVDLGTGNNNKINWPITDAQEFIDIIETIYRGARKGRGLVISPKDYSYNINTQNNLNLNTGDTDVPNIYELPPQVNIEGDKDNIRRQSTRGDQGQDKDVSKKLSQQAESSGYDVEGGNVDQVNWLHKSNDATVGLQWHYTYHPSDQRQFVQQTDQKNKEDLQQQSIQTQFSNLQQNPKQEEQIKYIVDNSDQQESHWQPQNYATEQGIKSVRKPFRYIQHENKLMSNQQIRENENLQKHVGTASSEPKLEPRILEVYGGGQYDPTHSGDIYSGVTINPSATLSPTSNTDPWDIREKPEIMLTTTELTMPPLPVEPLNTNDTNETPRPSSLWTRIGHKITTTFDKAKEKARNIFG